MDNLVQVYFNKNWVWCGVAEVYSMSCLLIQFIAYLFNSVGCGFVGVVRDR